MNEGAETSSAGLIDSIKRGMPITADLSRSDLLLITPRNAKQVAVVAQAQPHSIASIYANPIVGQTLTSRDAPAILEAWSHHRHVRVQRELIPSGAPIVQDVYPILSQDGQVTALLSAETSLIQLERHRSRHRSFRQAIDWLKGMCTRGELAGTEELSPFGEWDGVLLVDAQRRISYLSGIANNLYRRLGYMEDLRGRRLSYLNTRDDEMVLAAINSRTPLEREVKESSHIWVRKVLPLRAPPTLSGWLQGLASRQARVGQVGGVLIMVHDATEERRKTQELKVKTTMIQEVHHRVKNNLQAIAAMLRMQARRTRDQEAVHVLKEATTRILSVAIIHEFLSLDDKQMINLRDACQRIITQNRQVAMAPETQVAFSVQGPEIYLPSQQATACVLVVNELIQNALEHGFGQRKQGQVRLQFGELGDRVRLEIWDDGAQLPADFDLETPASLGLQIVRTLVRDDLHGEMRLANTENGVIASVEFPKQSALPQGQSSD